jgi:hypothetical protein
MIYIDTYNDNGYTYEDFVEYCKEQNWDVPEEELDIPSEDSDEYLEWVRTTVEDDIECFFTNLKYAKGVVNEPCEITGSLGLWYGRRVIIPTVCDNLAEAINRCWGSCDYVSVSLEDGVVYVRAAHHDGTNKFEIRPKDGNVYPKYLY